MNGLVNRILVADDDPVIRRVIQRAVEVGGWKVEAVSDGQQAWASLDGPDPPRIAVLDWQMPGFEGTEVCRMVRARAQASAHTRYAYLLMLTARTRTEDVVVALDSGADDYIMKPFHAEELRSRLRVAERIIRLEWSVEERVRELEGERRRSAQLEGLLPICMHCKRIRDEHRQWASLEEYIGQRTEATFTHGLCEDCHRRLSEEEEALRRAG